ncbi:MAG: Emiliania huxleyi virus 86 [Cyanobacteriota bacterium]|jgi:ATP-dependent Clp endopeptidase proteolytic subunit ClpP
MTKMQSSLHWCSKKIAKKAKKSIALPVEAAHDDDEESGAPSILPMLLSKSQSASVYSHNNKVFFNDDITDASCFQLNKELRVVAERMKIISMLHSHEPMPIYLHLTTNGGQIYSAFSVIDCIQTLGVPVYTVVDGFVASAGTLISICGAKRFMLPNAYMLIHELRSEFWGKMTDIEEEIKNLKKTMDHVSGIYTKHTRISLTQLEKILKRDAIWNAEECKQKGLVDEIY